jgi:hypothetical protein
MNPDLRPTSETGALVRAAVAAAPSIEEPLTDPRLQMLRDVTRQMATAENFETVSPSCARWAIASRGFSRGYSS